LRNGTTTKYLTPTTRVPDSKRTEQVATRIKAHPADALDGLGIFIAKILAVVGLVFLSILVLGVVYGSTGAAIVGGAGFALAALFVYAILRDIPHW
jgi:uncharacterized membrane protein